MKNGPGICSRKPWLAAVLSLLCTGLGHIYCGRFVKGLTLFVVSLSYVPITFWAVHCDAAFMVFAVLFSSYLTVAFIYFYAVLDSFLIARRTKGDYHMRDYNHGLVYALFIVLGVTLPMGAAAQIRSVAYEAFTCPAKSMEPNVAKGDYFLVNKRVYQDETPEYGDIVVFRCPGNRQQRYIKRLIALPGDRVAVTQNRVQVNGKELPYETVPEEVIARRSCPKECRVQYEVNEGHRYLILLDPKGPQVEDFSEVEVPEGHCFVLGDNRDCSRDGRFFGFVPLADVIGRAEYIYFPARSWSRFGKL
jgi:signal peptidase I